MVTPEVGHRGVGTTKNVEISTISVRNLKGLLSLLPKLNLLWKPPKSLWKRVVDAQCRREELNESGELRFDRQGTIP